VRVSASARVMQVTEARSDPDLVDRARQGDAAAFSELVRRHQRGVVGLCLRYTNGDWDEAADLGQQAFVRAWQALPRFRGEASFRGWLYKIAGNLGRNRVRDRARWVPLDSAGPEPGAEPDAPERLRQAERAKVLRAALGQLPAKQQRAVELRAFHDLSFREVAEVMGGTENAAKVNYHYGLKALTRLLGPTGGTEDEQVDDRAL